MTGSCVELGATQSSAVKHKPQSRPNTADHEAPSSPLPSVNEGECAPGAKPAEVRRNRTFRRTKTTDRKPTEDKALPDSAAPPASSQYTVLDSGFDEQVQMEAAKSA